LIADSRAELVEQALNVPVETLERRVGLEKFPTLKFVVKQAA